MRRCVRCPRPIVGRCATHTLRPMGQREIGTVQRAEDAGRWS